MILDVGCGNMPRGDINCDRYLTPVSREKGILSSKNVRNFICCDAQYLPFRDKFFTEIICHQVIEHVKRPILLLKELIRVSSRKILLSCPHRYSRSARRPYHLHYFNVKWFDKALKILKARDLKYFSIRTRFRGFPHPLFSLIQLPEGITVEIWL